LIHAGLNSTELARLEDEELYFWAIGYVEYTDVFGQQYSARYCRRYLPGGSAEQSVFETTPGYNDEVERN